VLLRETIRKSAEAEGRWVRVQSPNQYAHVEVRVTPLPRGSGIKLDPTPPQGHFPDQFIPGVEQGFLAALAAGVVARCEVTDLRAEVTKGSYHEQDSDLQAFEKAAEDAMRKAIQAAEPFLLEPVLRVLVTLPEEFAGAVLGGFNRNEGAIVGLEPGAAGSLTVTALIPEREFPSFERALALDIQKRAAVSSSPGGYQELRPALARRLRYCSGCERKVFPGSDSSACPDCGASLDSRDDYDAV
jgi:elongation factor G